jgi:5,10-methylenetetrahydromethanopterin reductase
MGLEFWTIGQQRYAGDPAASARLAEAEGWDGVVFSDTQSTAMELYVSMTIAALSSRTIQIASFVTNPITRHPAVAASAIATLATEAPGRVSLGLGRGDSALAHLGRAPAAVGQLRSYLSNVQKYLRGESIPIGDLAWLPEADIGKLPMSERPSSSELRWVSQSPDLTKPPIFVAGSGPQVIKVAAELSDRVLLAVGADPARVRSGVDLARAVRPDVPVAAFVNVVTDADSDRAFALGSGALASHARFNAMHGRTTLQAGAEANQDTFEQIASDYDMHRHARSVAYKSITPAFAEKFAIFGPANYCIDRLTELAELGIDRFHVIQGQRFDSESAVAQRVANDQFLQEVVSALA